MRIFTDGAEMQDVLFWTQQNSVSVSSGGYMGGYRYGIQNAQKDFSPVSEFYFRERLLYGQSSGAGFPAFQSSGVTLYSVYYGSYFTFYYNGTTITTSVPILGGIWYLIEVYIKIADAGGRAVLKIDGNIVHDFTGDTQNGSYTTVNDIHYGNYGGGDVGFVDDIALNDTNDSDGKGDISWCGDGTIIKLTPSGSGLYNNWINSGSVSGSANYLYVDEYPYDTTTTIYASASSSGSRSQFALTDFTAGGNITRIYAEARAKKESANDYGIKIGEMASGSPGSTSASRTLLIGTYSRIVGNELKINPVTGLPWTTSDLNALELIVEVP